jgi:sensor histidine kinase YesM
LGDLLRHTLDRQPVSRLEEELDLLRQYLEIERIRFGDRLIVEEEIDPDTLDVPVPALILQPLVENAVRHGIAPTPGPGRVVIGASRVNGSLRLSVRDTGSGFPPVLREGIGLSNTRARLAQLYGDRASLSLNGSGGDSGAVVTLILPIAATEN